MYFKCIYQFRESNVIRKIIFENKILKYSYYILIFITIAVGSFLNLKIIYAVYSLIMNFLRLFVNTTRIFFMTYNLTGQTDVTTL